MNLKKKHQNLKVVSRRTDPECCLHNATFVSHGVCLQADLETSAKKTTFKVEVTFSDALEAGAE